ncbi:MAG: BNR-repeat neuraminidase N-terminal domain-containing protein [Bacteroidales bacterium]|nr:BNR-repeat neuraminidase N-terminal domain-containing protein [Bacteroidales bacterium]MDD3664769.1 BNR-repeat neuraminidase N-terminal domain-containing protein [Bacteroidales bacterium]
MRKLFTLLIALFLWAGSSWGQTVTIGTGTSTSSSLPINAYYGYSYSQQIYTQAQIGTAGVIEKIRFYKSTTGTVSNSGAWVVYMGHTSKTSYSSTTDWIASSGLTTVFNGTVTFPSSGWMEITLSTPFSYNNTDNLVIAVDENTTSWNSSSVSWYSFVPGTDYRSLYYYADATNPNPASPPTGTRSTSVNQVQLVYQSGMTFTSSTTVTASSNPVLPGSTDQPVVALQVVVDGSVSPFSVSGVDFTTSGTTNVADLSSAKVYYTTSSTFSNAVPYGSAISSPSGTLAFTGTQALSSGNNYFWLCYDIAAGATPFNVVDATCTQFVTTESGSTTRFPTETNPVGSRTVRAPLSGTYTIDNTMPTAGTNYNSFTEAIDDLNGIPLGGPVVYNVTAGQTFAKTVGTTPYNYAYAILNIGTAVNTITFQKSGSGSNPVLSITGSSATNDFGMFLYGTDYITFNGIDVSSAGTTSTDYLEAGFYLQGPADDNCMYVTIKNCLIDLNAANTSSKGIYTYANAPTTTAGSNHNNTFQNVVVQDAYSGVYMSGNSAYFDYSNSVTGCTFQNLGSNLSTAIYPAYLYYQEDLTFTGNTIQNITGAGSIYGLYTSGIFGNLTCTGNTVQNYTGTSTSSTAYGMYLSLSNDATGDISGNIVKNVVNAYSAYGVYLYGGSNTLLDFSGNDISGVNYNGSSSSVAYGLHIGGGTTLNIFNNFIYDIKAAASTGSPGVRALSFGGGTTANVYYNTVYIDYTSTAATNKSAALYLTTSPTTLNMNNNIFVNNCDMTTGTVAAAFYKSSTALTNLASTVNNNLYYAGTPGAKNLIFYDGTNSDQTIEAYKTRVAPRESASVTENPPFLSSVAPYNFRFAEDENTVVESSGITISGINDDYDKNIRQGSAGYAGTGISPDLGAIEFEGRNPNLATLDMGATALVTPITTGCYTAAESVTITVKNWGIDPIDFSADPVTVTTEITGAVTQTLSALVSSGTLAPGATQDVVMSTTLDMTTAGVYTFNASTSVTGDGTPGNDAMAAATRTVVATNAIPFVENFDASTTLPTGWTATSWSVGTDHANPSTGNGLYKNLYGTVPTGQIYMPKLGPVVATDNLSFEYRIVDWTGYPSTATPNTPEWGAVDIYGSTDCGVNWSVIGSIDPANHVSSTDWAEKIFSLVAFDGADHIIIRIDVQRLNGDWYIDFDNFEVMTPPTLDAGATALVAPASAGCFGSAETVTVTIKNLGPNTLDFSVNPVTVNTEVTGAVTQSLTATVNTGTLEPDATMDVPMTGTLDMTTVGTYTFNATTVLVGDGNATNDAMPAATRTVTASLAIPFSETFNAATTTPAGWNTSGWTIASSHGRDGNGLYKNMWSSATTGTFILPKVGPVVAGNELLFDYRLVNFTGYPATALSNSSDWGSITIKVSSDCGTSFADLAVINNTNHTSTTDWATMSYSLAAYEGESIIVKFEAEWLDGDYYADFDNFEIRVPATCLKPTSPLATPGIYSAELSWTETGTATSWDVQYGDQGFVLGAGTTVAAGTNPYTLGSLTPEHDYTYYVRANCGGGDYSDWSVAKNFTTLPSCPVPTALLATPGVNDAELAWTENGTATLWDVEYGDQGFVLGAGTTVNDVTNPYTLTPLTANYNYSYYVRANCGGGDYSDWSVVKNFSTTQVPATLAFTEDFETGFGNWTVINGTQTNKWVAGTAVAHGGTQSAYISNDAGVTNAYTITSSSTVHIYRDITFPAGADGYALSFWWKGLGETSLYDYLRVSLVETSVVPVAGTLLSSGQIGTNYYNQETWQNPTIMIPNTHAGTTKRLVFTWKNDGIDGTQPPVSIDDILLQTATYASVTTDAVTAIAATTATSGGNVTADGNLPVTARGVCWNTTGTPTTADSKTTDGTGTGTFTSSMTGLTAGTPYYVRAYATNALGTSYGSEETFSTLHAVTFNVDMSTAEGFDPETGSVYISGSFATWPEPGTNPALQMARVGVTDIFTITLSLSAGDIQYKYFAGTGWEGGEWSGAYSNRSLTVSGTTTQEEVFHGVIGWANLQWPATATITVGGSETIYGQAFIDRGITEAAGATYGLTAEIGVSDANTDPSTWLTWTAATFNTQSGNNDEFSAAIGSVLTEGTYYYTYRYRFGESAAYYYGGTDGQWNGTSSISGVLTVNAASSDKTLNVTVFLEGPFDGSAMTTTLNTEGLIPLTQPYNTDPWLYEGTESVAAIPADVVDWVLVDLRDADAPENALPANSLAGWPKAMFLKNDGSLVDLDGNAPNIGNPTVTNNLYIVIRHRNHLDVMSAFGLSLTGDVYSYDFSTGIDQAYGGANGYKEISAGVFGMVTGDMDGDSDIGVNDFTLWAIDFGNAPVYMNTDVDMDSDVGVNDFTKWASNFGIANPVESGMAPVTYRSQVPGIEK